MKAKKDKEIMDVVKSFKAFAFLFGSRFFLIELSKKFNYLQFYDEFEYDINNENIPFDFILNRNIINVVYVKEDLEGNYSISLLYKFEVTDLSQLKDIEKVKDVLDLSMIKYHELNEQEEKRRQEIHERILRNVGSYSTRKLNIPKSKTLH